MKKCILGIDPGSCITGFGVIELDGKQMRYLGSGAIRLKGESASEKLGNLWQALDLVIAHYNPTEMAIEAIFLDKNPNSALKLGQARGVALAIGHIKTLKVSEYTPRQVKLGVTGKGGADKIQVQYMASQLLNIKKKLQADAADALAIALCHAHIQTTWGGMIGEPTRFSRKRTVSKRTYKWPNYEK